jgi:hypothetical protein
MGFFAYNTGLVYVDTLLDLNRYLTVRHRAADK